MIFKRTYEYKVLYDDVNPLRTVLNILFYKNLLVINHFLKITILVLRLN